MTFFSRGVCLGEHFGPCRQGFPRPLKRLPSSHPASLQPFTHILPSVSQAAGLQPDQLYRRWGVQGSPGPGSAVSVSDFLLLTGALCRGDANVEAYLSA